jgi:hypothetical protein
MSGERLLQRPIYGGVFGEEGSYSLASVPCVSRGLYSIRYMVVQPKAGIVLSMSEDKAQALADARVRLSAANDQHHMQAGSSVQAELWPDEPLLTVAPGPTQPVSRRRRSIYDQSSGKCHYCGVPLDLSGKWHIEHQQPRALGGGDDPLNLVAACAPCNLTKRDRTALEFVTQSLESEVR